MKPLTCQLTVKHPNTAHLHSNYKINISFALNDAGHGTKPSQRRSGTLGYDPTVQGTPPSPSRVVGRQRQPSTQEGVRELWN